MTSVASLEEEFFAGKSIAGGDPNFWKRSSHFPPAVLLPKKGIPNKFHAQTAQANEPSTVAVAKGTLLFLSMLVVIVWLFSLLLLRDCFFLAASCASNSALRTGLTPVPEQVPIADLPVKPLLRMGQRSSRWLECWQKGLSTKMGEAVAQGYS